MVGGGLDRIKRMGCREKGMNQAVTQDDLMTVSELAARLRVTASWVYTHADSLGVYRLGKFLRFDWDRVLDRLEHPNGRDSHVGLQNQRPTPTLTKEDESYGQGTE
jgi:hypothetical protein